MYVRIRNDRAIDRMVQNAIEEFTENIVIAGENVVPVIVGRIF